MAQFSLESMQVVADDHLCLGSTSQNDQSRKLAMLCTFETGSGDSFQPRIIMELSTLVSGVPIVRCVAVL